MSVHQDTEAEIKVLFCIECDAENQEGSFGFSLDGAYEHLCNLGYPHNRFYPHAVGKNFAKSMGWTPK